MTTFHLQSGFFGIFGPRRLHNDSVTKDASTRSLINNSHDRSYSDETILESGECEYLLSIDDECRKRGTRTHLRRTLVATLLLGAVVYCFLQFAQAALGAVILPLALDQASPQDVAKEHGPEEYPMDVTRGVKPLKCHSHNDYWRSVPLYDALRHGCTSIEADVWLTNESESPELYVGHSFTSLRQHRTLRSLYIDPILSLLNAANENTTNPTSTSVKGLFATNPSQPLILLIDIKNNPRHTFAAVSRHLEPFREANYLTYHNGSALVPGPLTIVATGSTPYTSILAQDKTRRDIFFDAPLALLASTQTGLSPEGLEDFGPANSLYASASLGRTLGTLVPFLLPWGYEGQLEKVRAVTRAAYARGLKVRWWEAPSWPVWWRERVWGLLMEAGADVLNVDDLGAAREWEGWE